MNIYPIWKDIYVSTGIKRDTMRFRIYAGDVLVYEGVSHLRPGEATHTLRINDICSDYLENTLPSLTETSFQAITMPVKFKVTCEVGEGTFAAAFVVYVYKDWSYDDSFDVLKLGLAHPINARVDARQWLIHTFFSRTEAEALITLTDGTSWKLVKGLPSNDFNDDFNEDFARSTATAGAGSMVIDLSKLQKVASVTIDGLTYTVTVGCGRYVLHYLNAYGGWDSLLIEGNSVKDDTLTRYTLKAEYDNRLSQNRGERNYLNEIERRMTLHTGWLTDEESMRMHHLLGSTDVYLEDLEFKKVHPVVIEDTSFSYKTYKNNGCKLVNYEIIVKLAQNRIRR